MSDHEEIDYEPQDIEQALFEVNLELEMLYDADSAHQPLTNDGVRGQIYELQRWRDELQRRRNLNIGRRKISQS